MEKLVYVCNCNNDSDFGGYFDFRSHEHAGEYDKIKEHARKLKTVYTLQEFQDLSNDEELDLNNSFILID